MANRKRDIQIKFFVDEVELNKINAKISKSKLNKSDYLRKCAMDKNIMVIEGLKDLALEISRIGNNINQLTKAVNQGFLTDTGKLKELETQYNQVFDEVLRISKKVK